jgi:hypothetical protein
VSGEERDLRREGPPQTVLKRKVQWTAWDAARLERIHARHERLQEPVDEFEFDPRRAQPRDLASVAAAQAMRSSVIDYFEQDVTWALAMALENIEQDCPAFQRAYLLEDAYVRLARCWDYLVAVLATFLELDRTISRNS